MNENVVLSIEFKMYLILFFLPLFNAIICGLFGKFVGRQGSLQISIVLLIVSFFCCLNICKFLILHNEHFHIIITNWIDNGLIFINWALLFDTLTIFMITMVTFISFIVHLYSGGYMENDPSFIRFLSYLSLFTFLMFTLITSDNFIQLFFGWEGVGLCSYLLISFWNTRIQASKAAIKALLMNRIGDLGLLVGICLLYYIFRSLDFAVIFTLVPLFNKVYFTLFNTNFLVLSFICFFLFVGACGKSAQLGLHTWLPDAMEGPTPVSALIHAATMVTAGVFLIIRCSILFECAYNILPFITLIGVLTAFFASTIGLVQFDIKKVIAYSTCSQLGYMVFTCGLSQYNSAIFHLVNHAFFKALLFLTAGAIIHSVAGEQDIRQFGGLLKILPFTYIALLIGSLALIGFPFFSGFYSKDNILEMAYINYTFFGNIAYFFGSIAAFFTSFYSFRIIYLTFYAQNTSYVFFLKNIHELPKSLGISLFFLILGSIFFGFLAYDIFVGIGSTFWNNSIYIKHINFLHFDIELIPWLFKSIPTIFTFFGSFFGWILFSQVANIKYNKFNSTIENFFILKWHFDFIYNRYIGYVVLYYAYNWVYIALDKGLLELFGAFNLHQMLFNISSLFKQYHTGLIYQLQCLFFFNSLLILTITIITL